MQGLTLGIAALIAVQGIGLQQADGSSHSRGIIDNEESDVISIEKHLHGSHHKSGIKIRLGFGSIRLKLSPSRYGILELANDNIDEAI